MLYHRQKPGKIATLGKGREKWKIWARPGQHPHLLCNGWEYGPQDVGLAILRKVPQFAITTWLAVLDRLELSRSV
jgi:hypothetical protein